VGYSRHLFSPTACEATSEAREGGLSLAGRVARQRRKRVDVGEQMQVREAVPGRGHKYIARYGHGFEHEYIDTWTLRMTTEMWKLPVAATGLVSGPRFSVLPGRRCEISMEFKEDNGVTSTALLFEGIEAFKCTYITYCTAEMLNTAYGKLVQLGTTSWLADFHKIGADTSRSSNKLKHLMICFDDGPCYEFICTGFKSS
jgi:hypothetical protein